MSQPIPKPVEIPAILAANPFASVKVEPGTNMPSAMKPPAATRSKMNFFDLINIVSPWVNLSFHLAINCQSCFCLFNLSSRSYCTPRSLLLILLRLD